ncbi:3-hydroxyacyl-CoA dehydrogenase/enoyl-CoA hydratase family protein [Castellaniella sp.]|uniref:3-hydroxyacyl-CoA dehydrogenase/enoyl-CoA hydratase family protein n=1 Tax=Castellaniella sp. TaxID=1955812 RepID=UPI00356AA004
MQNPSSIAIPRHIRRVAVCGAGVMGAQIAAHCANAGLPVILFDLASPPAAPGTAAAAAGAAKTTGPAMAATSAAKATDTAKATGAALRAPASAIAAQALARLARLKPAALGVPQAVEAIRPANYEDDLALLAGCDLIIEAVAERLDIKRDLYHRIAPHVAAHALLASNTSGLSLAALSDALPEALRTRFCGVHFFNPPRYMPLVELIPTAHTRPELLDALETFLVGRLGKSVVRAHDTPNFIGNRIGVFGILSVFHHTQAFGLPFDLVDDLTGTRLGRARSGTFRTADVVGLDTLAHVIRTMQDQLPDDPFHACFGVPPVLQGLLDAGALGQKTGAGFYKKEGKAILRLDPASGQYVASGARADDTVRAMLALPDPAERLAALHASEHPQARFVWAVLRDAFHYSALHLGEIAASARELDSAMRWGFGHALGPLELWQAAGWQAVAGWIADDIAAGQALSSAPLPAWVTQGPVWQAQGVHGAAGSFSPARTAWVPRSRLPVYARQVGAERLVGEPPALQPRIVFETDAVLAWTLPAGGAATGRAGSSGTVPGSSVAATGPSDTAGGSSTATGPAGASVADIATATDDVLIVSFKTKMHTLGPAVVDGVLQALERAERDFAALVVGQLAEPFSAGADLKAMLPAFASGGPAAIEPLQRAMQDMTARLASAQVPVVAALAGLALGGGCELALHCARRVAHFETWMGLVEVGMGLVPGGGGLAWAARRAAELQAEAAPDAPLLAVLKRFMETIATARVSTSALDARALGWLRASDPIVMQRHELLHVAVREARQMADAGWHPPVAVPFPVAGRDAIATLRAQLLNLQVGGFISEYDAHVATEVARVLCGGDLDPGSRVDTAWMHQREREAFLGLLAHPKTQARIAGFIQTGKPVRN